jgi:hypothetical protein
MRDLDRKCAAAHGIFDYDDLLDGLSADLCLSDGDEIPGTGFSAVALPGQLCPCIPAVPLAFMIGNTAF